MAADCRRGEIYLVNWTPGMGIRPAVIIQNDVGNKYSPTTIVAACTTAQMKDYPFIVKIPARESGLDRETAINLSQIMTINKDRLQERIGVLTQKKVNELNNAIKNSLDV